jgi:iron complex outermembrane recepter protein
MKWAQSFNWGRYLLPSRLFGEQRNRGIEFTVNGEVAPGLRLIAGVSHNDAELVETLGGVNEGNSITGVPDWTANVHVEWDLPFVPGLTLTGRMTHTGAQFVDGANTLSIPDWTVFDVGARYVVVTGDTPITLRLTVDNVTNERYWASAFDAFSTAVLQGRPRTVNASISIDF